MRPLTKKGQVIHYLAAAAVFLSCVCPCQANDLDTRSLLILHSQTMVMQHVTLPAAWSGYPTVAASHPPVPSIPATPLYYSTTTVQPSHLARPVFGVTPATNYRSYSVSCVGRG